MLVYVFCVGTWKKCHDITNLQESASSRSPLLCPSLHPLSSQWLPPSAPIPGARASQKRNALLSVLIAFLGSWCIYFPHLILLQNQPFYLSLWCVNSSRTMTSSCWLRTIQHVGSLGVVSLILLRSQWARPLLTKVWSGLIWKLVISAETQTTFQNYWAVTCMLKKIPIDSQAQWHVIGTDLVVHYLLFVAEASYSLKFGKHWFSCFCVVSSRPGCSHVV